MSTTGSGDEHEGNAGSVGDPPAQWPPPRRAQLDPAAHRDDLAPSDPEVSTRARRSVKRLDMTDDDDTIVPGQSDDTVVPAVGRPPTIPVVTDPVVDTPTLTPPIGPTADLESVPPAVIEEIEVGVAAQTATPRPTLPPRPRLRDPRARGASRGLPTKTAPRRRHDDGFGRAAALTVLGTIVPGAGLLIAGRKRAGAIVLAVFVLLVGGLVTWGLADRDSLLTATVLSPAALSRLSVALLVVAVLWVGVVIATHLALRPDRPARMERVVGGVLVGLLSFAVAAPMAVAARYSYDSISAVSTVFKADGASATRPTIAAPKRGADPWADTPRVNVLLLGGDSGADRTGTRTDTVMVASIDTKTGDTTLISLPRNTGRMPFPTSSPLHKYYPNGFTDGDGDNAEFFLNAMYDNVPAKVPANVLGKTDNLGADTMKISVGEALGLKISYYVLIDFKGFRQLVNALGGINVNINTYVAIGGNTDLGIPPGSWLKPGADQHLDGDKALWFARGRYGADDFQRMDRQRCVIDAIIEKANPANLLTRYEKIATAGKAIIKTDIPQDALPMMVDLGTRVQGGNVRSVVFKNGVKGFSSPDPDYAKMRARVKSALGETKSEKPKSSASSKPGGSKSTNPDTSDTSSDNITDACAYQPSVAETAVQPR